MSVALVPIADQSPEEIMTRGTATALVLPDGLSKSRWAEIGEELGRAHLASAWWIGDWINYGENAGYVSREKYDEAERITGMKRKTLWNYASFCRQFESSRRREDLSAQHHDAVRGLPPTKQDEVLDAAASDGLTIHETRSLARVISGRDKQVRVPMSRRHSAFIEEAGILVRLGERWERSMTDALTPPQAKKQLTILNKAAALLAEVIEACEYRADTPKKYLGR